MIKKMSLSLITIVSLALFTTLSVGCSNDSSKSEDIALTPNSGCLNGQNNCTYSGQYNGGFRNYPRNTNGQYTGYYDNYQSGFCGCQAGYSVAYSNHLGLTCINHSQLARNAHYFSYGWNYQQYAFSAPQPRSYNAIPSQYRGACNKDVLQTCLVIQSDSCGSNGYCRAIGGGDLGLCLYR